MTQKTRELVEMGIIGSLLTEYTWYGDIQAYLRKGMFEGDRHKKVLEWMDKKHKAGEPWDTLTISDQHPAVMDYAFELSTHMLSYIKFIEYFRTLQMHHFFQTIVDKYQLEQQPDVEEMKEFADTYKMLSFTKDAKSTTEIIQDAIIEANEAGIVDFEMPTMYSRLNKHIKGFIRKQILLIVAATSNSKTVFTWNLLLKPLLDGKKVLAYDLEMPETSLFFRLAAMHYRIPLDWMDYGKYTNGKPLSDDDRALMTVKMGQLADLVKDNLIIRSSGLYPEVEQDIINERPDIVCIDTIQAFCSKHKPPSGTNKADYITYICSKLNDMAKKHDIAMVQVAQVNRATDGGVPGLASISESGGIANNAASVVGVRDKFFMTQNEEHKDVYDVNVCKSRHGKTGRFKYTMNKPIALISEWEKVPSIEEERKVQI